jgi:malate dehydrogenase (oxaloacetate-decarboxylating)
VTLAGLINALKVVGKNIQDVRIVFVGAGASNVACSRLIFAYGANPANCLMLDSKGTLGKHRDDLYKRRAEYVQKWHMCQITNADGVEGDIPTALKGADVVIALSQPGPDTLKKEWIAGMAKGSIVFACANPIPEIWPWEAVEAGAAVVATGRSDFPNQVNNSLGFPGIFRGTLDVRGRTITDEMAIAAAVELAKMAEEKGLSDEYIIPNMDEWEVFPREAAAVAMKAIEQGIARFETTFQEEFERASTIIKASRDMAQMLMREGFIAEAPEE